MVKVDITEAVFCFEGSCAVLQMSLGWLGKVVMSTACPVTCLASQGRLDNHWRPALGTTETWDIVGLGKCGSLTFMEDLPVSVWEVTDLCQSDQWRTDKCWKTPVSPKITCLPDLWTLFERSIPQSVLWAMKCEMDFLSFAGSNPLYL